MAKSRNEEKNDCGKHSSRKGSHSKNTHPLRGKRCADGKQQESSTNTEKTARDQPGCKTSHDIPPWKKTYALVSSMSIDSRLRKVRNGKSRGPAITSLQKYCFSPMPTTNFTQRGNFSPLDRLQERKTMPRRRASIAPRDSLERWNIPARTKKSTAAEMRRRIAAQFQRREWHWIAARGATSN